MIGKPPYVAYHHPTSHVAWTILSLTKKTKDNFVQLSLLTLLLSFIIFHCSLSSLPPSLFHLYHYHQHTTTSNHCFSPRTPQPPPTFSTTTVAVNPINHHTTSLCFTPVNKTPKIMFSLSSFQHNNIASVHASPPPPPEREPPIKFF